MSKSTSLYIHGLGRTELRPLERLLLDKNQRKGLNYAAAYIDWCSPVTFSELVERVVWQASEMLSTLDDEDVLILEGSSAGGSMAINALKKLDDPRVRAVSHSGRLSVGNYSDQSWRNLARCAHLGTHRASQSFFDSVTNCESVTVPSLTDADKSRIVITLPIADEVVPVQTMTIEGVRAVRMPIVGHSLGIGMGILKLIPLAEEL